MKKINIGLLGASGKMGLALRSCLKRKEFRVFNPFIAVSTKSCEDFAFSVSSLEKVESDLLKQVNVWIEFSSPESCMDLLKYSGSSAVISGTTGFTSAQFAIMKKAARRKPVFWASNMSQGVWALRQALKALKIVKDFDFIIEETHHTQKKDNPSGTAKTLRHDLEKIVSKKVSLPKGKRIGEVFGEHEIRATSQSEVILFKHAALNREVFAEGALKAAKWIVKKKKGFYSMEDL